MFPGTAAILGILIFLLLPADNCLAGEDEPIVWVAEGISLKGTKHVELLPAYNDTGAKFEFDVTGQVTDTIRTELTRAGLNIVEPVQGAQTKNIGIQIHLVHYQPGSVGGRWVGFGGGAALCIIRTYIIDGTSGGKIADIIVAEQVEAGGLFSIGAGKYVPERAAKGIARELAGVFGIELKSGEVSE